MYTVCIIYLTLIFGKCALDAMCPEEQNYGKTPKVCPRPRTQRISILQNATRLRGARPASDTKRAWQSYARAAAAAVGGGGAGGGRRGRGS